MSRSSFARRARKGRTGYRLTWRIDLLPPRSLRGLRLGASATAVAVALLASPMPAFGAECDPVIGGIATCTSAGGPLLGNDFTDGITYTVDDLTIVLESDVVVDTDAAAEPGVSTDAAGALVVYAYPGTVITTTVGPYSQGVFARSTDGPVTVTVATVTTIGDDSDGVYARSYGLGAYGAVSVTRRCSSISRPSR